MARNRSTESSGSGVDPVNSVFRALALALAIVTTSPASAAVIAPAPSNTNSTGDLFEMGTTSVPPDQAALSDILSLINAGNLEKAASLAKTFVDEHPESAAGHEIYGDAIALLGKIDDGLKELRRSVEIDPRRAGAHTKIGDVLMAKGDDAAAQAEFLTAIGIDPSDSRAHQRLGLLYEKAGDDAQALSHFEKGLVGTAPGYVGIKVNLANLYNRAKRYKDAVSLLEPVVGRDSKNATAQLVLGTAYLGLHRNDEAKQRFERLREIEPKSDRSALARGLAYREIGDSAGAIAALREILKRRPDFAVAYGYLGDTYAGMKRWDEAIEQYRKGAAHVSDPSPFKKRIADAEFSRGNADAAIADYAELAKSEKAGPAIFDALGAAYQVTNRRAEAERTFKVMVARFPDNPLSYFKLGSFYGYVEDYDAAVATLKEGLARTPDNPALLKALSLAYLRKGDSASAISEGEKLVRANPANLGELAYVATLHGDAGETQRAGELYRQILAAAPDNLLALNNYAALLSAEGNDAEGLTYARKAAQIAPDNLAVADTYGWILHRTGANEKALDALRKAAAGRADSPTVNYHLGVVQTALGDKAAARDSLKKALSLSSDFKEAADARARLQSLE